MRFLHKGEERMGLSPVRGVDAVGCLTALGTLAGPALHQYSQAGGVQWHPTVASGLPSEGG